MKNDIKRIQILLEMDQSKNGFLNRPLFEVSLSFIFLKNNFFYFSLIFSKNANVQTQSHSHFLSKRINGLLFTLLLRMDMNKL